MKMAILMKAILLVLVLAVAPVPVAWAQFGGSNQGGGDNYFDGLTSPKAAGKSMVGVLDVNPFQSGTLGAGGTCKNGTVVQQDTPLFTFDFNFRVVQGNTVTGFSFQVTGLCAEDIDYAVNAFNTFVNSTVISTLYPGATSAVLRSYKNFVQSPYSSTMNGTASVCCDNREWIMMDMEFAVK